MRELNQHYARLTLRALRWAHKHPQAIEDAADYYLAPRGDKKLAYYEKGGGMSDRYFNRFRTMFFEREGLYPDQAARMMK